MQPNLTCRTCGQPLATEAGASAAKICPRCRARRRVLATILRVTALILILTATMGAAGTFAFILCPSCRNTAPEPEPLRKAPTAQAPEPEPVPPPPARLGEPQAPNP